MNTRFSGFLNGINSIPGRINNSVKGVYSRVRTSLSSVNKVVPFFKPENKTEKAKIVGATSLTIITVGLNVLIPILFQKISRMIAPGQNSSEEEIAINYQNQFMLMLVAHGAGWTIAQWGYGARRLLISDIAGNAMRKFNVASMGSLSEIPYSDFKKLDAGEVSGALHRASGSTLSLSQTIFTNLLPLGGEIILKSVALAQQYQASYSLTALSVLGTCAAYSFCTMNLEKKEEDRFRELVKELDAKTQHLLKNWEAIEVAMTWDIELKAYDDLFRKVVASDVKRNAMFEVTPWGQSIILGFSMTLVLSRMGTGKFSQEVFNMLNLYMMSFSKDAINLCYTLKSLKQGLTDMEISQSLLENKRPASQSHTQIFTRISLDPLAAIAENKLTVQFNHVTFGYKENKKIFDKMSVKFHSGEMVAVVGKVGSGKSSILRLLYRFCDPTKGEILLNGRNIQNFDKLELRKKIAIALQETLIVPGTLLDNLTYGCPKTEPKELHRLVEILGLKEFIAQQKDGYDTNIRGLNLSGGQKQILGLVRTLLRKGVGIYIFDEITSALDPEDKQIAMNTIQEYTQNKIVLMITHDVKIMSRCSRAVVLSNGQIAQDDAPSLLAMKHGLFRQFLNEGSEAKDQNIHPSPTPVSRQLRYTGDS